MHCQVFLTDCEQKVLDNLRDCVAMNFPVQASGSSSGGGQMPIASHQQTSAQQDEDEFGDPDDAESCDDMDDLFASDDQGAGAAAASTASDVWDYVRARNSNELVCFFVFVQHTSGLLYTEALMIR